MKGLILKDLYNLKKHWGIIALLMAFYAVFSVVEKSLSLFGSVFTVMCVMLPITAFGYDEKARWDKYALAMPVSRNDMVISKYILALAFCLIAGGINVLLQIIFIRSSLKDDLLIILMITCAGVILFSVIVPIIVKFGAEKGRIYMLLVLFLPTGMLMLIPQMGLQLPDENFFDKLPYILPLAAALFFLASVLLSMRIYKNKEM